MVFYLLNFQTNIFYAFLISSTSSSLIRSTSYSMRNKNYEAPRYSVFSITVTLPEKELYNVSRRTRSERISKLLLLKKRQKDKP